MYEDIKTSDGLFLSVLKASFQGFQTNFVGVFVQTKFDPSTCLSVDSTASESVIAMSIRQ